MKTIFNKIVISYSEYEYFKTLDKIQKLEFLFDSFDTFRIKASGLDLSDFFGTIQNNLERYTEIEEVNLVNNFHRDEIEIPESEKNHDFVDVTIDDKSIMIESNSLRATRAVTNKFIESGYMLSRDLATEKMFKRDKNTRYIRVFRIISCSSGMCLN
jgi:hypothetical protein